MDPPEEPWGPPGSSLGALEGPEGQNGRLQGSILTVQGRKNLSKWTEGAKIMYRLSRHQALGPDDSGILPKFLEFEH